MKEKIYLIPGLMTDQRLWSRLESHLDEYELVHLPIPLHEDFDKIIEEIDSTITCEKINLLGFSLGGYIASYYALKNPKKVNRLFLLSSTPSNTEQKDIPRRMKKLQEAREDKFTPLGVDKARELLEIKDDDELVEITCSMFNDLGNETFVPQLACTLKRVNLFDDLKDLDMPIKFFYSSEDRLLNHVSIENIQKENYNFKLVKREGISHNIPLEFPDELSNHIREWLVDG